MSPRGWLARCFPLANHGPGRERTTDALSKSLNIHLLDCGHLAISVSMGDVLSHVHPTSAYFTSVQK